MAAFAPTATAFGDPSRRRENDIDGGSRLSSVVSQAKRAVIPVNKFRPNTTSFVIWGSLALPWLHKRAELERISGA